MKLHIASVLLLLASGCATAPWATGPRRGERPPAVEWLGDGRLLVEQQAIFDPAKGTFTPIPEAAGSDAVELSPSGRNVMVWKNGTVRVGPLEGPLSPPIETGAWLSESNVRETTKPAQAENDTVLSGYWLSDDRIYVQQSNPWLGQGCRILDVKTHEWQPVQNECLHPLPLVTSLERLAEGWVGVTSEAESGDFAVLQYTPDSTTPPPIAFDMRFADPENEVRAYPARDGTHIQFVSPCALEHTPPKPCVPLNKPWHWYSWSLADRSWTLVRAEVPPDAQPDPTGTRLLWTRPGGFCLGDPAPGHQAQCTTVPPALFRKLTPRE